MLKLDLYSDGLLFQCDRCHRVGELVTDVMEEDGEFYCWNCLGMMNQHRRKEDGMKKENYALKRAGP